MNCVGIKVKLCDSWFFNSTTRLYFSCFFLDKIKKKMTHLPASDSMEVDSSEDTAGEIDTLINDCKFKMKLRMANSAWKQVKKPE